MCVAIDPCQEKGAGYCHSNAKCQYLGPGKVSVCIRQINLYHHYLKGHCHRDFAVFRSILCQNHCLVTLPVH